MLAELLVEFSICFALGASGIAILVASLRSKDVAESPANTEVCGETKPDVKQSPNNQELVKTELETTITVANDFKAEVPKAEVSLFQRLTFGLAKTNKQLFAALEGVFTNSSALEAKAWNDSLFESLIGADVGVATSEYLLGQMNAAAKSGNLKSFEEFKASLKKEMQNLLVNAELQKSGISDNFQIQSESSVANPHVVMMVGVNGVGKTTSTGKLAHKMRRQGNSVVIAAADTFRAAAVEQLRVWASRSQAEFVSLQENSDPASVAFEAVKRSVQLAGSVQLAPSFQAGSTTAPASHKTWCFVDTAGRLHNRADLMQELEKIKRVMGKAHTSAPQDIWLVLDATTGQNALTQAKMFNEIVPLTGIVLTKLDGTAKGGIVFAIAHLLKIPIKFVGVGESVEDLQQFQAVEFVDALFS